MINSKMIWPFFVSLLMMINASLNAQSKHVTYSVKKGQMMDFFFLKTQPGVDSKEMFKAYREKYYGTAKEYTYHPEKARVLPVKKTLQGSRHFDLFLLGVWDVPQKRIAFAEDIGVKFPEFHDARRAIWQAFDLTYVERREDLTLTVRGDRYNVVTAYWEKDGQPCAEYVARWRKEVAHCAGDILFETQDGDSPYGYHYDPDYFFLTEWKSEKKYQQFISNMQRVDHSCMANINEFEI